MNIFDNEDSKKNLFVGLTSDWEDMKAFRHPFVIKLIECGLLPRTCKDFAINFPIDDAVSITATYFIDKERFEQAVGLTKEAEPIFSAHADIGSSTNESSNTSDTEPVGG